MSSTGSKRSQGLPLGGTAGAPRQTWMDLLRGLAVVLIVVYHAAEAVIDAGLDVPAAIQAGNEVLAPFRIPMLTFLSGLLLSGSLRKGAVPYFEGKISNIAWPYLVWLLPHTLTKDEVDPLRVLLGETQLWFLLFLGFYYVLAFALQRVPPPVVAAGALALSFVAPGGEKYGERLWFLFACFMIGHWAASRRDVWPRLADARWVVAASLVILMSYLVTAQAYRYGPGSALGTAAGVLVLCHVARRTAGSRWAAPLSRLGRDSLVVYVSHGVAMQAVVLLAALLGMRSGLLLYCALLVVGMAVPIALIALKRRWRPAQYLFTLTPQGAPFPVPLSGRRPAVGTS